MLLMLLVEDLITAVLDLILIARARSCPSESAFGFCVTVSLFRRASGTFAWGSASASAALYLLLPCHPSFTGHWSKSRIICAARRDVHVQAFRNRTPSTGGCTTGNQTLLAVLSRFPLCRLLYRHLSPHSMLSGLYPSLCYFWKQRQTATDSVVA